MALEGTLDDMPLAALFHVFRVGGKSGVLLLAAGAERCALHGTSHQDRHPKLLTAGRGLLLAVMRRVRGL